MKKIITTVTVAFITLIGTSAFVTKNSTGMAGYTGSPVETTCSNNGSCHGGGTSSAAGVTITSSPAFSVNANSDNEYLPDSTYQITVTASAAGFSKYGFDCEILDAGFTSVGTIQNPGSGVKFVTVSGRRHAVHTTPKSGTTVAFTFKWVAPAASNGDATIYTISNAVNGNGNTTGDFVIPPVSMLVVEGTPPPSEVGIKENTKVVSQISIFPNPVTDLTTISYSLQQTKAISVQLIDIKGSLVKELYKQQDSPGSHSQILNLQGIAPGVYFIKVLADQQKVSQKLITVQ